MEHYLAQFCHDLDETLQEAWSSIPADIFQRIATGEAMEAYVNQVGTWLQTDPMDDTTQQPDWGFTYIRASFLTQRKLALAYLSAAPDIWVIRVEDEVIIRWKSNQRLVSGDNIWESTQGEYRISASEFIQ